MTILQNDWSEVLGTEFEKAYYKQLRQYLVDEYNTQVIYPLKDDIYNALHLTPYANTKVVILGQDPYHGEGQAHGLSFSVKPGVKQPPSLKNIFKELQSDLGHSIPNHGFLESWAKQGVLLLNAVLTVREKTPNAHKGQGWENFTDEVIHKLNERDKPIVFILWGKYAQAKKAFITNNHHHIIESAHPSPLSARNGFFGSRPFSKTNEFLRSIEEQEIDWSIANL
ncbi:uracil-DNA glycosylase [Shimazuella kribbensis]|uniref:uracil-DNA glycosylase n=1 Tax=Shimazuella kribbensis TaxID=139808 RepID=UPI00041CC706|nr:uracil-DNA glycosylase [Shimazuella kribbensis]